MDILALAAIAKAQQGGGGGMSDDAKEALLDLLEHVAYTDENGAEYLQTLEDALYNRSLSSITAVFTQGSAVIYDTDSLDDLKEYLVVTAHYSDSTDVVLADSAYTLSGTLTAGTSTITVSYGGKTDTFSVLVTASGLPAAYQKVEYLEGTGTQYITTNIMSQLPMACEAEVAKTAANAGQIIGAGTASDGSARFFLVGVVKSKTAPVDHLSMRVGAGGEGYNPDDGYNATDLAWIGVLPALASEEKHAITSSVNAAGKQTITVDNTNTYELTKSLPNVGYPIQLFKHSNENTTASARIYSVKLYSGDTLLAELIPCKRKSDSVAGMYDVTNDTFYTNAGSGTFAVGNDV